MTIYKKYKTNNTLFLFLDNYKSFSVVKMKPVLKNGNTYLEVKSLDFKFTTSKMHLIMNNLFNGDKILGEYTFYKINDSVNLLNIPNLLYSI